MTTDMKKLARLADVFLDAADFPLNGNARKLGAIVERGLDDDEKKIVENELFNAMVKKTQGDTNIRHETLALADVFCKAAARMGLEKQAAQLLPLEDTDRKTVKQLRDAGFTHLAHTVKFARNYHGL